jgi:hypothetical protein
VTDEGRLDAARRALAGFRAMLASAVASEEALHRLGDATLLDVFATLATALRLMVRLAEAEVTALERREFSDTGGR